MGRGAGKALALCGSPRPRANTEVYLEAALDVLEGHVVDTELVTLEDTPILSCRACYVCWESSERVCQVQGDGFHELYRKMLSADALLVGSPVHYSAVHPGVWSVIVAGATYWTVGVARSSGDAQADEEGIGTARRLGENVAWLLESVRS